MKFLQPLNTATERLAGSRFPTLEKALPIVFALIVQLQKVRSYEFEVENPRYQYSCLSIFEDCRWNRPTTRRSFYSQLETLFKSLKISQGGSQETCLPARSYSRPRINLFSASMQKQFLFMASIIL